MPMTTQKITTQNDFLPTLQAALALHQIDLTPTLQQQLHHYFVLAQKWGQHINFTRNLETPRFVNENILDPVLAFFAIQSLLPIDYGKQQTLVDLGTGGGFVGIIWHLLWQDCHTYLIDGDRKKINFCKTIIQELGLKNIQAVQCRAENLAEYGIVNFSHIVSRATWQWQEMKKICLPYLMANNATLFGLQSAHQASQILNEADTKCLPYKILPEGILRYVASWSC